MMMHAYVDIGIEFSLIGMSFFKISKILSSRCKEECIQIHKQTFLSFFQVAIQDILQSLLMKQVSLFK